MGAVHAPLLRSPTGRILGCPTGPPVLLIGCKLLPKEGSCFTNTGLMKKKRPGFCVCTIVNPLSATEHRCGFVRRSVMFGKKISRPMQDAMHLQTMVSMMQCRRMKHHATAETFSLCERQQHCLEMDGMAIKPGPTICPRCTC